MIEFLTNRPAETNKYHYGHALLIAGSLGKMGAAILAAKACLRTGAGLLTVHVPKCGVAIMQTALPEAMVSIDESEECFSTLPPHLERYNAIAVGPGLGTSTETRNALSALFTQITQPLVLDADALNCIALDGTQFTIPPKTILTPHAKEYERLFGNADPQAIAQTHYLYIVKKNHQTKVFGPIQEPYTNTTGNPGMATAGSGDVLTGIILGLSAQGFSAHEAACIGVSLHGKSGDIAAEKQSQSSIIASDIIENLKTAPFI